MLVEHHENKRSKGQRREGTHSFITFTITNLPSIPLCCNGNSTLQKEKLSEGVLWWFSSYPNEILFTYPGLTFLCMPFDISELRIATEKSAYEGYAKVKAKISPHFSMGWKTCRPRRQSQKQSISHSFLCWWASAEVSFHSTHFTQSSFS